MLPICYFTFVLCSLAWLSSSLECNRTQYPWPVVSPKFCCNMCPPGHRMIRRTNDVCGITCEACQDNQYIEAHNVEMNCKFCEVCNKENMVYKSNCSATHNAVCACKAGYRCENQDCTACELIPTTTKKPTLPPPTKALKPTTPSAPPKPMGDKVWFLVIIALLCAGIALAVVTKIKPFLRWTRSIYGYFLPDKQEHTDDADIEDNDMPKPVQEVCGKCDQPIEV
ncbi:tumor necrosis factor receptor superfamily member 14 [Parambassis ranga]|uniref:Tumor necrosis factor receptor superfamily member 14-like n=1 Tax=Parambassis ranga TaxID=210632 RepID=A0A6P7JTS8_9TELE|nr:tumor necrosis factor receptor superfamily member 14-like [Parambassis ranga]XP_028280308.1 tumor necrosis factor receptor superfamily member 14-like [Parambassis ranga]XP_028280309.1 tumor necrosis factor receptor superfamily member 14-like [Parambassis ranga]XP_028280310.1 tumor necrosis factor receptor superfamily member 14-like [Parambassis ranga]